MAFVLKDGQGTLHRNDKGGVEARPDYRGQLNIGGMTYDIAGWLKDGKQGKWMSLSAKVAERRESRSAAPTTQHYDVDSDIPF